MLFLSKRLGQLSLSHLDVGCEDLCSQLGCLFGEHFGGRQESESVEGPHHVHHIWCQLLLEHKPQHTHDVRYITCLHSRYTMLQLKEGFHHSTEATVKECVLKCECARV